MSSFKTISNFPKKDCNIGMNWSVFEDKQLIDEISNNKCFEEIALNHKRSVIGIKSRIFFHIIYPKHGYNLDISKISTEYKIEEGLISKLIDIKKNKKNLNKKNILGFLQKMSDKQTLLNFLQKNEKLNLL